jgi:hypothetical protein
VVRWLFPGKLVRLDANCLDCGEDIVVEIKDKEILEIVFTMKDLTE